MSNKLASTWTGPYVLKKFISEWVVNVQHLVTSDVKTVHTTRIRPYSDKLLNVTVAMKDQLMHDQWSLHTVEEIRDSRESRGKREFLIKWLGIDEEDSTWEPEENLLEDIPKMLEEFKKRQAKR